MTRTRALGLLIAWIAILLGLGLYVQRELRVSADLRLFMPDPTTPEQRLLLEELGEGPASRLLIIALEGRIPETTADASRSLVAALADNSNFRFVANGETSLEALSGPLLNARYLLSSTLDTKHLDAAYLRGELLARTRDLASAAGTFLEPLLPRDPTLEVLKLAESWQPISEPARSYDVWFDRQGSRALLLAETRAPPFDPEGQRAAIAALEQALARVDPTHSIDLTISGTGAYSAAIERRTRAEAELLGVIATVGMLILLLIAYRDIGSVLLSVLPIASAALAGLFTVSILFGAVHGITLAFGFTLIGVAQDYPLHLMSHQHAGIDPRDNARRIWPALATGVASTCVAYLAFLFSGVTGLAQLASFTISGLAVAGLTTRFLLPALIRRDTFDHGQSSRLAALWRKISELPTPRWLVAASTLACTAVIALAPWPLWENDLGKLTPVPSELLARDAELRSQLGAPDMRYLLVIRSSDVRTAQNRLEALDPALQSLIRAGAISGYDHAARYLPSIERQVARRARLPDAESLRSSLAQATRGLPFRSDVFEPFIADVASTRSLAPLTPDDLRESLIGARHDMLLRADPDHTTAFVTFSGVQQPQRLESLAAGVPDTWLLDLKVASETLVAEQRTRILWSLAIAAILLIGVVGISLRNRIRTYRVLLPMTLTTLLVIAVLHASGVSLTLFHLISLVLAAGLGLDYALFFEQAAADPLEQRRTLHGVLVCSCSTLMVFLLLANSSLPVLRAIGSTVALGVAANFLLALLMTRPLSAHE